MNPPAIGYVNAREKGSYAVQRAAIRERCKGRLRLLGFETDMRVAPWTPLSRRPGLIAALRRCDSGEAKTLIVASIAALGENAVVTATIVARLARKGVELVTLDGSAPDPVSDAPRGKRIEAAALYRLAVRHLERLPKPRARYGWRVEDEEIIEVPDEQAVIALARELREDGLTTVDIAAELTLRGILTRRGNVWTPSGVSNILRR